MKPTTLVAATRHGLAAAAMLLCGLASAPAEAQTLLADGPLFSANSVPGNLGLLLSVEYPTAVSVAHTNRSYDNVSEYLGFFDPKKCYVYQSSANNLDNFYVPSSTAAANHICAGKWSGNFLNWASMQTIDPFRWVLTGGYRVVDTTTLTGIVKAWASGQGGTGNFPDSTIPSTMIAGATPFAASFGTLYMRIQGMGNKMRFTLPAAGGVSFVGQYYNNTTRSGTPAVTRTDPAVDFDWGGGSPGAGVNSDNFSVRWTATITAPVGGSYRFQIAGDDVLELKVDGVSLIKQTAYDNWNWHGSGGWNAVAGSTHTIELTMAEFGGGAGARLQWRKPGDAGFSTIGATVSTLYDDSLAVTYDSVAGATGGTVYDVYMRAKVCDTGAAHGGPEANCTAYGSNWKPEGLLQKYANRIRYSAFGYLNDSNIQRDGGVLRARQKFVGPTQPVPGSTPAPNAAAEWDASTGVFVRNPNPTDVSSTNSTFNPSTAVADSGVINYLNKFGELTTGTYKTYDNVGELYYAAIRYFKNLGNVSEWTSMSGADANTKKTYLDGFPAITTWDDPILYSCQRNFLLGIGDVNTHADKNVPGNSNSANEPAMPAQVTADTTVNAITATNNLGVVEGLGATLGTTSPPCCSNNAYTMAGLAYYAHTKDIRPNGDPNKPMQTIDTYWVDVQEYQTYTDNNQFYLATKYGGFRVPTGFNPDTRTTALDEAWWHANLDILGSNKRPDNYFSGGRPDLMKTGLETAFADIASKIKAYTTSFSTSLPQVAVTGNKSFSSKFDATNWTGEIIASELAFGTGNPVLTQRWTFTDLLAVQLKDTGWSTNRRIATWSGTAGSQFCSTGGGCTLPITSAQLNALDPSYVSGNDSANYLNYLRGDTTNEQASLVSGSTKAYRNRVKLLGDIVGSKARPVGPPSFPFADGPNPGYSEFKATWATRATVVYVGANDGMMHAIHGDLTAPPGGAELFAYVPSDLFQGPNGTPSVDGLASLGNPTFSHHFLVNATPNVYDVDFARTPDDITKLARTGKADWRSILIGGLGKGGRSYYAIDVTDPEGMAKGEATVASKVLWEFKDTDLGYTYGDPIVIKTPKYGWVVIIPSGFNNTDGQGHLLIVNPRTGKLLEKVSTGVGSPGTSAGLAYVNAFVLDASDGTVDAVYAGDLLGNLWRWDVSAPSGAYPAPIKFATLTDASGTPQPVTSRPMIEIHPGLKKRFVLVGTGKLLDTTDISSKLPQSYYAIADGINARFNLKADLPAAVGDFPITRSSLALNNDPLVGVTYDPGTQIGWVEELGLGDNNIAWRVTTDATTLLGSVAWAATLPNGDVCSPSGKSRVYGRDFGTAQTTVKTMIGGNLVDAAYVSIEGNVTDLRYLSVNGKATLISGNDQGDLRNIDIKPQAGLGMRRLNWRELQGVTD